MVDDERMPLLPGEQPVMKKVRFRTLGCYPLTARHRERGGHTAGHHPGNAARPVFGAPGPRHRPRRGGFDGEEEAGGLFLTTRQSDLIASDIDAYLRAHERKSLLRFITCGRSMTASRRSSAGCCTNRN